MIWVETILNGIFLGGLYGLLGLGLALVFGVMRVINVSHGEFIVLAAYFGVMLVASFPGIHPLFLLLPIVIAMFAVGWAFQATMLNRVVESRNMIVPMLVTFGVSIVLRNGMLETFGANPKAIDAGDFARASFQLGGLNIGIMPLATLLISVLLFAGLQFLIRRTQTGRMIRATADNPQIMRLMGVNPKRVYAVVMGISLALAGIAGLLLALGSSFAAKAGGDGIRIPLEVLVLGGLGSFWGALLAGILLGVVQLVGFRFDGNSGLLYAHMLFFLFLIVRPNGLFGARQ